MRSKTHSVLMIGLLALGLLVLNHAMPWGPADAQAAGEPLIDFVAPEGTPRYMDTEDPIEPEIVIDVKVAFPEASTACAGAPLPADPATLAVTLQRQLDAAPLETWPVDTSGWTWGETGGVVDVTGQVTIGGEVSGQGRSLYGIKVCIDNASASSCATKDVRVEHPVSGFTAAVYTATGRSFSQTGAGCNLIPSIGFGFIEDQMKKTEFIAIVPSGAQITAGGADVEFIGIPLLGGIVMEALPDTVDNDVDLTEVAVSGIGLKVATFDCVISGKADGSLMGEVSPGQDLDGSIRVYDLIVTDGPGGCGLTAAPTCELHIGFDGNP